MIAMFVSMIDTPEEKADFEKLYNTYKGKMFASAYGILRNHHNAEEAVSQAFFTIAKNYSKVFPLEKTQREAYIKIVIRNAAIDIYRKEKRDTSVSFDEVQDFEAASGDISDRVLSQINYEKIVAAIRELPEKYAEPLYLFHVRDMNVKTISEHLCESEETIKKRLQRARQKLRETLSADIAVL